MGQQPNIELEISDLPRPKAAPAPARRWSPRRPGEMTTPQEVPWGGAFGTTGPDTGYALKLVRGRDLVLLAGEDRHNAEVAIAALVGARASHFGRAPIARDVDVAITILGLAPSGLPSDLVTTMAKQRIKWFANLGHSPAKARELVASVPIENLAAPLEDLRARMAAGERLILR